jgi:hypothetical protein
MSAMTRVFRGYLVRFGLAGAILIALPASALATPSPTTLSKSVSVGASGVTSATLRCPHQGLALSGYVTSASGGVFARDSIPGDIHRWSFNFTSSGGSGQARVGLRCLRLKLPKGVKQVQTKIFTTTPEIHPRAGSSAKFRASCRKGYLPVGYGIDRSKAGAAAESLPISGAVPRSRSWDFRVKNTGSARQAVTLHLRCLGARAKSSSGRKVSERFKLTQVADSVKTGTGALSLTCSPGYYALATGYLLRPSDDIFAVRSFPTHSRGGRFSFRNPSGGKERVRTYMSCLSLRTSFR